VVRKLFIGLMIFLELMIVLFGCASTMHKKCENPEKPLFTAYCKEARCEPSLTEVWDVQSIWKGGHWKEEDSFCSWTVYWGDTIPVRDTTDYCYCGYGKCGYRYRCFRVCFQKSNFSLTRPPVLSKSWVISDEAKDKWGHKG